MSAPSRLLAAACLPVALLLPGLAAPTGAAPTGERAEPAETAEPAAPADPDVRVTADGATYVVDPLPPRPPTVSGRPAARRAAVRAPYPDAETFALHSLPGAQRTVYLDFDGATVRGTWWNDEGLPAGSYGGLDTDGSPTTFNGAERAIVQEVWQRVAEDYAPFTVDVTTEEPAEAALLRSSGTDQEYGVRVVVTRSRDAVDALCGGGCVGVAFIGVFDRVGTGELQPAQPAWAFSAPYADRPEWNNDPVQIAETISHEVGHTLGLEHDSERGGSEYYPGHGIWSPVMGAGYASLTQWSRGEYPGAVNWSYAHGSRREVALQDDLAVIAAGGAPRRADDHGDTTDAATPLPDGGDGVGRAAGVVGTPADRDAFTVLQACDGPLRATGLGAPVGPNLDLRLTLLDEGGRVVATADPASTGATRDPFRPAGGLDAGLALTSLPAGRYTVVVEGAGRGRAGEPDDAGYSDYGSLGAYTLTAAPACAGGAAPPPTRVSASYDASSRRATLRWAPPAGEAAATVTGYEVRRVGGAVTSYGPEVRSAALSGLAPGTHELAVAAVDAAGTGTEVRVRVAVPEPAVEPRRPARPTGVRVARGPRGGRLTLTVTWRRVASPGSPLTGHRVVIQRLDAAGRPAGRASGRVGAGVVRASVQVPRGRYRVRIVALSAAGPSRPSAWTRAASPR